MLYWIVAFLAIVLMAGFVGFGGNTGDTIGFPNSYPLILLFTVFALFIAALIAGRRRSGT